MAFTVGTASIVMTEKIEGILRSGLAGANVEEANTFNMFLEDASRERTNELGRRIPFTVRQNASYGSITEGGQFPLPGTPVIVQGRVYYLNQFMTGEINGPVLDQESESDLVKFMRTPMDMDFQTFRNRNNLWMFGTGDGALGVVLTNDSSTVVTMGGDYGAENLANLEGARCQFYSTAGVIHNQSGAVATSTLVSISGNAMTFDAVPSDVVATDTLHYENSYGRAPHGIPYHISETSGTWLGLNTATYSGLKASVIDAGASLGVGGTALTPGMLDLVQAKARKRGGAGGSQAGRVMISHDTQMFNYRQLGYTSNFGIQRVLGMNGKLDLGIPMAEHNGQKWKVDYQCPRSVIYGLNLPDWAIEYTRLPGFYEFNRDPNQKLYQKSGSDAPYDALQYGIFARYDLVCKNRKSQWAVVGLPYVSGL
jgi:hypothetical protein